MPRRLTPSLALALAAALALLGCGGSDSPSSTGTVTPPVVAHLDIVGADLSTLTAVERAGGTFTDSSGTADALAILKRNGFNTVRLRLFHAPDTTGELVNSLAYDVALAQRVKQHGLELLLDIHYSDTWADPAHQVTPAAWASLSYDELKDSVQSYTHDVVAAFRAAGATPDIIQVGNEVNVGILWPLGHADQDDADWARFAGLVVAGREGARAALGVDSTRVRFLHHVADARNVVWHMDHLLAHMTDKPDLIGVSYYPFWHGTLADFRDALGAIAAKYDVPIVVAETAYPWTNQFFDNKSDIFHGTPEGWMQPFTPQGQAAFLGQLVNTVAATPDSLGAGIVYWEPAWLPSATFGSPMDNLTLFDSSGRALPALYRLGAAGK